MIPTMERILGRNLGRPIVEDLAREPARALVARSVIVGAAA
jgi:hypothetical protein